MILKMPRRSGSWVYREAIPVNKIPLNKRIPSEKEQFGDWGSMLFPDTDLPRLSGVESSKTNQKGDLQ